MAWKPEVQVMNEGDKWHRNGLVFATREEAEANAANLHSRWMMVTAHRAVEVDEPVNYRWLPAIDEEGKTYFKLDPVETVS